MSKKLYYIKERQNPQLNKSYYSAEGQLTKKEVRIRENNTLYGRNIFKGYATEAEYELEIENLVKLGHRMYRIRRFK